MAYSDLKKASGNQELPFELRPHDDEDKVENAEKIAEEIEGDPAFWL